MSEGILHVNRVRQVGGHLLDITFDNGTRKVVDVTPLLTGEVFEPLHDPGVFAKLTLDPVSRTIVWPNGADLAPEALYRLPSQHEVA